MTAPITIEGIYRAGKVELSETPSDMCEGTPVIVTFLPSNTTDLQEHGIDEAQAAGIRARLVSFAEDWENPEMNSMTTMTRQNQMFSQVEGIKMTDITTPNDELCPEYDETSLKNGIRGKYAE